MRPNINSTVRQTKLLEVRWGDWEVKFLGLMLSVVAVGGVAAATTILLGS